MKKLSLGLSLSLSSLMAEAAMAESAMAGAAIPAAPAIPAIPAAPAAPQPTSRRPRSKGKTYSAMLVDKQEVREWNAAVNANNAMKQRRKASRKANKRAMDYTEAV